MLFALLYFALLLGTGMFLVRPLALQPGERLLPAYVAASCAFGVLGLSLAHTRLLNTTAGIAITLLGAILSLSARREIAAEVASLASWCGTKLLPAEGSPRRFAAIAFGLYFLVLFLLADTPARSGDALRYHLAQLKDMLQHAGFVFRPYIHYHFGQYFTLTFFPVHIVSGGIGIKFAVLLTYITSLIGMLKIADRIGVRSLGVVAALLMLLPVTFQESTVVMVEWPTCAFITSAIYILMLFLDRGRFQIALVAYLAMGMAIGTKLLAGMTLPWLLYLHWFKSDAGRPINKARKAREIIIGLAVMGVIAAPFYIRSFYYFGNPVWPVLQEFFTSDNPYLDLIARRYGALATGPHSLETAITTLRVIALDPKIPVSFWIMGWYAAFRTRSRIDIGTGFILFFGVWWIIAPLFVWRYAMFMMPFAAITTGALLDKLREERSTWMLRLLQAGITVTLAYGVGIGIYYSKGLLAWHISKDMADYHHATWYYDEYDWMNQNLPESAKVLVFALAGQTYYLDLEYVRADPRLSAAIRWPEIEDVDSLRRVLNELAIDYVFVDWNVLSSSDDAPNLRGLFDELANSKVMERVWDRPLRLYYQRIAGNYSTTDVSLFKLVDPVEDGTPTR